MYMFRFEKCIAHLVFITTKNILLIMRHPATVCRRKIALLSEDYSKMDKWLLRYGLYSLMWQDCHGILLIFSKVF